METLSPEVIDTYERVSAGGPINEFMLLVIGPELTFVARGIEAALPDVLSWNIGARRLAREQFAGLFPSELKLEAAIAVVEDELMKKRLPPAGPSRLVMFDATLYAVATDFGFVADPRMELDLDAVERLFNRMAAVSGGSPASQQGIPLDLVFAARLLILRELMHHLGFRSVSIGDWPAS